MTIMSGDLVWETVVDPSGNNPKTRPLVVLNTWIDLGTGKVNAACVAVTTRHPSSLDIAVPLAFDPSGRSKTRLRKQSWAICNWPIKIELSATAVAAGSAAAHMKEIVAGVRAFSTAKAPSVPPNPDSPSS